MNLMDLFVKIAVDDQASGKLSKLSSSLGKGLATAAKVGTAAVATVTAAATAMTAAFVKGISEVAQYGDNIDKMSQKMGLSAEAYQEWDFIMQHSGTSMEALKAGMKTLANAVDSGNDAFERLGISQAEIASMNQEELFAKTIEQLQKVENETERTYLAGQLLGRGATELGALLNTSAEDTEAMRQQVHELGGVMSNEAVKAAAAYQDSLQNMQTAFSGIQRGMLSEFLPAMVTVMDGLALIFSGNDSGIAKITEGVNQFADKLMEAAPKIFELGEGILSSLATAILNNLPTLTSTATSVIIKIVDGIVSALPVLAESAIEIISSLTQGLSDNLPTIIESAVELIGALADGILNMLPQIIQLGLDLIVSLATGIAESLPELIPTIMDVILQIVDTLTSPDQIQTLLDASLLLVMELANGLTDAIPQLVNAVNKIIMNISWFLTDPKNIGMLLNAALKIIIALGTGILNAIPVFLENMATFYSQIFENFGNVDWGELGKNIIAGIGDGLSGASELWEYLTQGAVGAWNGIKNAFGSVASWFGSVFSEAWEAVKGVFSATGEVFLNIGTGILDALKTVVNAIISGLNLVIKQPFEGLNKILNTISALEIAGVSPFSWLTWRAPVPQIPLLYEGGVLKRGQVGILEGAGDEAIVPLHNNKKWVRAVAKDMGSAIGGGGSQGVKVSVTIDENVNALGFARELLPLLKIAAQEAYG